MDETTAALKRWTTTRAMLCRHGIASWRTDPADGPVRFITMRHNLPRVHQNLEALETYLNELGRQVEAMQVHGSR